MSNTQRYSDGYNDGAQQAITDFQNGKSFSTACEPSGAYTSDGQHTTIFCVGWVMGYTATWNNLVQHPPPQDILNKTDNCPMLVACIHPYIAGPLP